MRSEWADMSSEGRRQPIPESLQRTFTPEVVPVGIMPSSRRNRTRSSGTIATSHPCIPIDTPPPRLRVIPALHTPDPATRARQAPENRPSCGSGAPDPRAAIPEHARHGRRIGSSISAWPWREYARSTESGVARCMRAMPGPQMTAATPPDATPSLNRTPTLRCPCPDQA